MKGIHIFCASQSSTAISLTMTEPSASSSTIRLCGAGGGPAIDRHNPIIRDPRRFGKTLPDHIPSPSSPHSPIIKPSPRNKNSINIPKIYSNPNAEKPNKNYNKKNKKINHKSSLNLKTAANDTRNNNNISSTASLARKSWNCSSKAAAGEFISPPGSSRYLLSDDQATFFNVKSDSDPVLKLLPPEKSNNNKGLQKEETLSCDFKPSSSSRSPDQVVVLRVSLHCRGCERKMKKHISRMEGVSSFNIDFAAKKVTVVGNVTPLAVLASISKVKNAQLWTPPAAPPFGSH